MLYILCFTVGFIKYNKYIYKISKNSFEKYPMFYFVFIKSIRINIYITILPIKKIKIK